MPTRLMVLESQVRTLHDGRIEVRLPAASNAAGLIPGELVNLCTRAREYGTCQVTGIGVSGEGETRVVVRKLGESI
jgi:hypothetical protein